LLAPRQITFEANPGNLQDMVDNAINRALINQAGVLSNTVFNAVARTFKEGQLPPNYVGHAYHQPGSPVVTAPSATRCQISLFSGQDDTSTMEHVNRFIIQCGEATNRDELRVRLFSSSLSGSAFTWFISLPPNSSDYLGRSGETIPQILLFWSP